jgi:ankyrin repeat protein
VQLRNAAEYGNLEKVKQLIKDGADIHSGNEYALRWAAEGGHSEIVRLLIENGANISRAKETAVKYNLDKVIRFLEQEEEKLKEETININVQLRKEAHKGNLEKVKQLIEDGADISFESHAALRFAAQEGHINIVQFLIERALRYAIANNHPKVARLLIEHKADIAYAKKAAVKCMFHPDKVIQFLEQEEEKLKEETININVQLRKEAYEGNLEKVKQLIEDGADISFESHAALRFAAQEGHINIVQFLIETHYKKR